MPAVGGTVRSISIEGQLFAVTADADTTLKLGGNEAEVQANGDASVRKILTRTPWMLAGVVVTVNPDEVHMETLQALMDSPGFVPITVTYASGDTYGAIGSIVGELQFNSQAGTAGPLSFSGPGEMEKQ